MLDSVTCEPIQTLGIEPGLFDQPSGGPLYVRLQLALRQAIRSQTLPPDKALPPERELAKALSVSRITVRKAFDGLAREGLLVRTRGRGTCVASRIEKNLARLSSFSEDMRDRGCTPGSQWLSRSRGAATPAEAMSLVLSPGAGVLRFVRLRTADGAVVALESTTIPEHCLPSPEAVGESLYDALAETGFSPVRALQRLRGVALAADQAQQLGVRAGKPGLYIERRGFAADGSCCELSHTWYRGDAYDVISELGAP